MEFIQPTILTLLIVCCYFCTFVSISLRNQGKNINCLCIYMDKQYCIVILYSVHTEHLRVL